MQTDYIVDWYVRIAAVFIEQADVVDRPGTSGDELGVYHGAELPYVFDQHDEWLPTDDTDDALSAAIMDYWSSFAKNGCPQASKRPGWPVFTASRQ